jgi:EAL domain-containing protein (putative c-di-GMP-specific phosphodiesterase class I)
VAVNLSAVQISRPGFASVIAHALAESGLDPHQLVLEVTESTRLDQAVALQTLRELRALGLRLAIDDFGTGWASLSHLSHHPFDMVKIDQTFVRSIWSDPRAESLVTGVVDLARRLSVVVVAEGVEDAHQLSRLRLLGVELGQGFHFARPMPPRDLEQLLAAPAGTKAGAPAGAAAAAARARRSSIPATH